MSDKIYLDAEALRSDIESAVLRDRVVVTVDDYVYFKRKPGTWIPYEWPPFGFPGIYVGLYRTDTQPLREFSESVHSGTRCVGPLGGAGIGVLTDLEMRGAVATSLSDGYVLTPLTLPVWNLRQVLAPLVHGFGEQQSSPWESIVHRLSSIQEAVVLLRCKATSERRWIKRQQRRFLAFDGSPMRRLLEERIS